MYLYHCLLVLLQFTLNVLRDPVLFARSSNYLVTVCHLSITPIQCIVLSLLYFVLLKKKREIFNCFSINIFLPTSFCILIVAQVITLVFHNPLILSFVLQDESEVI